MFECNISMRIYPVMTEQLFMTVVFSFSLRIQSFEVCSVCAHVIYPAASSFLYFEISYRKFIALFCQTWSVPSPVICLGKLLETWVFFRQQWDEGGKTATFHRELWRDIAARFGKGFQHLTAGYGSFFSQVREDTIRWAKCLNRLLIVVNGRGSFGELSRVKVKLSRMQSSVVVVFIHLFILLKI